MLGDKPPKRWSRSSRQCRHHHCSFSPTTEFITNFIPPNYLIDGLLQRRFVYSMTGPTGEGKTSVALFLALLIDRGWSLDGREIDKG
jgi:hypothetical protein